MIMLVEGEKIQWHLLCTTYDRCPECGAELGFLANRRRCCMGTCMGGGKVITLVASVETWLGALEFSREEVEVLTVTRTHVTQKFVRDRFRSGRYEYSQGAKGQVVTVRPGFLRVAQEVAP